MSTSLLYHGWGLRGHTHRRTDFIDGCIVFTAEPSTDDLRCSGCGGREVRREGGVRRRWRTTPIGGKPVFVDTTVPRVWCASCGKTRQVEIGFAPPRVLLPSRCLGGLAALREKADSLERRQTRPPPPPPLALGRGCVDCGSGGRGRSIMA